MLDIHSEPTIRFAIIRRLDDEPGVKICDLRVVPHPMEGFFAVGILADLGAIVTRSRFDLPIPFELGHLHNEIDEVAEQFKAARKEFFGRGAPMLGNTERQLAGSGLRGRWARYG